MTLKFSDGVEFDTSGPLRIESPRKTVLLSLKLSH